MTSPLSTINANTLPLSATQDGKAAETAPGFLDTLKSMISSVNDSQVKGDKAIENLESGKATHLHEVMLAVEEADISLRMLVQIRNRAVTAYDEIMRMNI